MYHTCVCDFLSVRVCVYVCVCWWPLVISIPADEMHMHMCVCAWLRDMRHVVAYLCDIETGGRPQSDYYVVCYAHSHMVCVCIRVRAHASVLFCVFFG